MAKVDAALYENQVLGFFEGNTGMMNAPDLSRKFGLKAESPNAGFISPALDGLTR